MAEIVVFALCAAAILAGAIGVIVVRNPVHSALNLVVALFGVAVLFVSQEAHFLGAIQVIVYTGAIVVLILFVLMLLGVDVEEYDTSRLRGQRAWSLMVGGAIGCALITAFIAPAVFNPSNTVSNDVVTGKRSLTERLYGPSDSSAGQNRREKSDVELIGRSLVRDRAAALQITAALLTVAVVGTMWLARRKQDQALSFSGSEGQRIMHQSDYSNEGLDIRGS